MNHREALQYLSEYGIGVLEPGTEASLAAHVDTCPDCLEWLTTRDLLAAELSRDPESHRGEPHPDSDLLALCVVRPEEILELDREELRLHLERCPTCRKDLDLMRSAVREARPGEPAIASGFIPGPSAHPRARGYVAAIMATVLLGAGVLLGSLYLDLFPTRSTFLTEPAMDAQHPAPGLAPTEELSGRDLEGTQVIGSDRPLVISKLTVKSGADITFNGGEVVAFGDGFRVAKGARITVGTSGPRSQGLDATDTPTASGHSTKSNH